MPSFVPDYYMLSHVIIRFFCITKWGTSGITKCDSFFCTTKCGKSCYKVSQVLQIWEIFITKWVRYHKAGKFLLKVGQVLQSGAINTT